MERAHTRQAEHAVGGNRARRYRSEVEPFIAAANDDPESLAALADLIPPGEQLVMLQMGPVPLPPGVHAVEARTGVQMVARDLVRGPPPDGAEPLGDADVAEMIALAELTKPGPFRNRTHKLGQFWGIRRDGRLIAMAGERMKLPGSSEVSGVCTHPDWRGHSFARALSAFIAAQIADRGETPFLHAYADNAAAIGLYESLGFAIRTEVAVRAIVRAD